MHRIGEEMLTCVGGGGNALEPVSVTRVGKGTLTLLFLDDEPSAPPAEQAQSVTLYFQGEGGFMQQEATIREPINASLEMVVALKGEAVSGESREFFRVSMLGLDYYVCVGGDESCKVVDVSSMGMAVNSSRDHAIGDCLPVSFVLGEDAYSGECMVQSAREAGEGWRYGLLCVNGPQSGNLGEGLVAMTKDAQVSQCERLSGLS